MFLVRYSAFKMVCDFWSCTGATTLPPPGYVYVGLLSTHATPFQIRQMLFKPSSNGTNSNGLKPPRAMLMPNGSSGPTIIKEIVNF